ncbi:hypothetical protein V6N13_096187 [Hibiscus sabdariffa]|uniref:Uncharacterized protein n=2 Tax=Hibiscus sabdariffa TaxID=183260 RepID=A0ABR2DGF4_9ROSI
MGALVARVMESVEEDIEAHSCFHGACYTKTTRLATEGVSVVVVEAASARNYKEIAAKNEELYEANRRVAAKDEELFEANGRTISMAKKIEALRRQLVDACNGQTRAKTQANEA